MIELFVGAALAATQDQSPLPPHPCAEYEAAIAPLNSNSVLCGFSVESGNVTVHYPDGRTFPVNGPVRAPGRIDATEVTQFWVMDAGQSHILGLRGLVSQTVYMIARDESGDSGWNATPVHCGEYGPDHVYSYDRNGEYAFAAYSLEGHITFCALGTWQHNQEQFFFEYGADLGISLDQMRVRSWSCGGEEYEPSNICFTVSDPAGNEIFRHE